MGNELQNFNHAQLPAAFANGPIAGMGDMTEGVSAGFPVVSFKGKVWKIKVKGEEHIWLAADGSGQPAGYVDVVVVNASSSVSKIWYEKQFREGEEMGPPDCWSTNGVVPDAAAPRKPSPTCAGCPKNVFGTSNTGKGKACGDVRRLAVVPATNILDKNSRFGGPMLLRVPPTSLTELAGFQRKMAQMGYPYYAIISRIAFDPNSAFQKLVFTAVRPLNNEEAQAVIEMGTDDATQRMLNETVVKVHTPEEPEDVEKVFAEGTGGIAPKPAAPTPFAPAPVAAPAATDPHAVLRGLVGQGVMTKDQFKAATGTDFDPPAPKKWEAKPEHAVLVTLVESGTLTHEQFEKAAGYAYGGEAAGKAAPAPEPAKAPWAPKPEHAPLAELVKNGVLSTDQFAAAAGYAWEGPAAGAAAPAPVAAPAPAETPAPTRKRRTKAEVEAEKAAAAPTAAAPAQAPVQTDIEDAIYTEQPADGGLDAALDGLFPA